MAEKITPIPQGLIQRVSSGVANSFLGDLVTEWFGPLRPMNPITTEEQKPSVEGRQFDYEMGFNLHNRPRMNEGLPFEDMRGLAETCNVLRLVIESRKDQMAKMTWTVQPKDTKAETDARCEMLNTFFAFPDKENSWADWLRMLLEEMFVVDAATIYTRKTLGGQPYAFELMDGTTIVRKLDPRGRTPIGDTAYQQVLKGLPVENYTVDELLYAPRNKRVHKAYGFSPVEQIIMTVNIALRRQLHQLQAYTEGSTPDLIFSVPKEWTPEQVKKFKGWWDLMLLGDTAGRRGTMFVPDGLNMLNTKDALLKDEYDEWLARIVCYAFSISPQAFIKEVTRANGKVSTDESKLEGTAPLMQWVKGVMDHLIWRQFGFFDLEFTWTEEESIDPLVRAQVNEIYMANKVITPDEVRADLGLDPLSDEERAKAFPAPPAIEQQGEDGELNAQASTASPKIGEKLEKGDKTKKLLGRIDRERKSVQKARKSLTKLYLNFLEVSAASLSEQIIALLSKADLSIEEQAQLIIDKLKFDDWTILVTDSEQMLIDMALSGVTEAMAQIGIANPDVLSLANKKAIEYAMTRAAELVGMKRIGGELVINASSKWSIADTTREGLRKLVVKALTEGLSNDELAELIQTDYLFSKERAEKIARTETAFADVEGNMIAYRESGLVKGKKWLTAGDDKVSDDCRANGLAGEVELDSEFPSGAMKAPDHPNCRCDIIPILINEME